MAERQGWNGWNRYKAAGIVDEHVNFSDEKVIIDHAIGKSSQTVGACWPMDAAVAYTLAAAGPQRRMTSMEMVNQYTRMAAVMMSQKVAYGEVPDPDVESCGHDEVNAYKFILKPVGVKDGAIEFRSRTSVKTQKDGEWVLSRASTMLEWLKLKNAPEELYPLAVLRAGTGSALHSMDEHDTHTLLKSERFAPLRSFVERALECDTWVVTGHSESSLWYVEHTYGECQWKGSEATCAHHDRPKIDSWVLIKAVDEDTGEILSNKFDTLWSRKKGDVVVQDGWNYDQLRSHYTHRELKRVTPERVVLWDKVKRNLANQMDEKQVRKEINASLRRMLGRNLNCVTKEGLRNTATFQWKNWSWLTEMQAWVAQTSKKNRKEGDVVRGWKYTKYNSRMSFGHEIAKFKWIPEEPPALWEVNARTRRYSWSHDSTPLPLMFPTEADALRFKAYLIPLAGKCNAGNRRKREWDGEKGAIKLNLVTKDGSDGFRVTSTKEAGEHLEMEMNKDPEGLPTPDEMLMMLCFGSPQEYTEAREHLVSDSKKYLDERFKPSILEGSE